MACCDSSDCSSTYGAPLGLLQCINWAMDNNLIQKVRGYGAFDAYVIQYAGNIADQLSQAVDVTHFLARLSTCSAFWHVLVQG
jgi:hypothetical protein